MKNKYKNKIEVIARAIILTNGKFLLCREKGKDYYFFPGGHINFKETAESALIRELKEELNISINKLSFIGIVENIYEKDNETHHEINLVFEVLVDEAQDKSKENHIDFFFKSKKELIKEKVLPVVLTKAVLKWLNDKKTFWVSQIDK